MNRCPCRAHEVNAGEGCKIRTPRRGKASGDHKRNQGRAPEAVDSPCDPAERQVFEASLGERTNVDRRDGAEHLSFRRSRKGCLGGVGHHFEEGVDGPDLEVEPVAVVLALIVRGGARRVPGQTTGGRKDRFTWKASIEVGVHPRQESHLIDLAEDLSTELALRDVPDLGLDPALPNHAVFESLRDEVAPELRRAMSPMDVVEVVRTKDRLERVEETTFREGSEVGGDDAVEQGTLRAWRQGFAPSFLPAPK